MTDRRFFTLFTISLIVVTSLPFLFGFFTSPSGTVYTGIHKLTPGDFPVYYSYIEQARDGQTLFRDLYTGEPQRANIFFPFWWLLGTVGRLAPFLSAPFLFQLARVALIPAFCWLAFSLIKRFTPKPSEQRALLFFLVFASGIGALIAPGIEHRFHVDAVRGIIEWPMDLWVPEAFTFLGFLNSPHVLAAEVLLLGLIYSTLKAGETPGWRWSLLAAFSALSGLLIHPFLVYPIAGFFIVLLFVRLIWRQSVRSYFFTGVGVGLFSLPVLLYDVWLSKDPLFQERQMQNALRFPSLDLTLASYGFLLPLALIGLLTLWRRLDQKAVAILIAWFFGQGVTLLVSFTFVRRLTEGFHVPLALLAGLGFFALLKTFKTDGVRWSIGGILIILLVTSSFTMYLQDYLFLIERRNVISRPKAVMSAYAWLRANARPDEVTLTDPLNGNYLPAYAVRPTYLGHDIETVGYREKFAKLQAYANATFSVGERANFLRSGRVTYVLNTPELRLEEKLDLSAEPSLQLVKNFGEDVALYRVKNSN